MYVGGVTFLIEKPFGRLQCIPESAGLRFEWSPYGGEGEGHAEGTVNFLLPLEVLGNLWTTIRAFLYEFESLNELVILKGNTPAGETQITFKLYRDKPTGPGKTLSGEERVWLRILAGVSDEGRTRLELSRRDLVSLELACQTATQLAVVTGTHKPRYTAQ